MKHRTLIFAAILALLNAANASAKLPSAAVSLASSAGAAASLLGVEPAPARIESTFTCMQLLIMDELELLVSTDVCD